MNKLTIFRKRKLFLLLISSLFLTTFSLIKPHQLAESANLSSAKDTMDISRVSWKTTLSAGASTGATTIYLTDGTGGSIIMNSILPGDSVKFWGGTTESLVVATVNTTNKFITLTTGLANNHASGSDVSGGNGTETSPKTGGTIAIHTITFIPSSTVQGGEIRITFPVNASTPSDGEPDADGFDFNGIGTTMPAANFACTGGGASVSWGGERAATTSGTSGTMVFPFRNILAGTQVTCTIGNATRATGSHLVSPSKTAASGTADTWTVTVESRQWPNYQVVDSSSIKIATVESVKVTASVNPTLSVIVAGTGNGAAVCGETTNSGTASTAVLVPLGTLASTALNLNAQTIAVATNATNGYTTYVKDDGALRSSGGDSVPYSVALTANDTPVPAVFNTSGTANYGVSACGTHVNTSTWGAGTGPTVNKYGGSGNGTAWQYYRTLVSYTAPTASTMTNVLYKATISGVTPAGDYSHIINYVVSGVF